MRDHAVVELQAYRAREDGALDVAPDAFEVGDGVVVTDAGDILLDDRSLVEPLGDERLAPALLTPRQTDVLGHLARGQPNRTIARDLGMSESTVKVHVRNIMRKLKASNRTEVVFLTQARSAR